MKFKNLLDSFNYAIDGIIYAVRTQRNMRIHMVITLVVLTLCLLYDITKIEFLIIMITITLVITAELINTAVEAAIDATTNYFHPLAKIAKNVSAGAVFITAINAVVVGYIIFWDKLKPLTLSLIHKIKNSNPYLVFIVLVIVCVLTVIVKAIYGEGTPLKGGMPSGHSALAFSIATCIALIAPEASTIILSYLLAIIVAQSRVDSNVHSSLEVIVGAAWGSTLTIFLFKVFGY